MTTWAQRTHTWDVWPGTWAGDELAPKARFEPPTERVGVAVSDQERRDQGVTPVGAHLLARYRHTTSKSVLKTSGVYSTVDAPTQTQIDAADEVYLGGRIYDIDEATATALEAAGYVTEDLW